MSDPAPARSLSDGPGRQLHLPIGGFTAETDYIVRLHFFETYWTAAGEREFNVSINEKQVLTHFDIYATARQKHR